MVHEKADEVHDQNSDFNQKAEIPEKKALYTEEPRQREASQLKLGELLNLGEESEEHIDFSASLSGRFLECMENAIGNSMMETGLCLF